MKKLVFGLIAIVLFAFNGSAQEKLTKEEVRVILAQDMVGYTNALKPAFEKSTNLEEFKKTVAGSWYDKMPEEGNNLLEAAYKILSKNLSEEEIIKDYNGKEMAAAALYFNEIKIKNPKADGSEVFGGTTGDFNPYATLTSKSNCKWYQIACWLKEIFGDEAGALLLAAAVRDLLILLATL